MCMSACVCVRVLCMCTGVTYVCESYVGVDVVVTVFVSLLLVWGLCELYPWYFPFEGYTVMGVR